MDFQKNVKHAQRTENHYAGGAKHRCAVCGRTELDDPNLEFRYCSKCNGNYEYCQEQDVYKRQPFILVNADPAYSLREGGCLADIAPTLIELMGMEQPKEMTGKSLLVK